MATFTNILCPVDLSPISRRALEYAVAVGRQMDGRVTVLEVVDASLPPLPPGPWPRWSMTPALRQAYGEQLNQFVEFARSSAPLEIRLVEGPVVPCILGAAVAMSADLIVMGTHGRSGFERFVLGSVAEKVLRKARCPVLAVPPSSREPRADRSFGTIVCGVDFSAASLAGIRDAAAIAAPDAHLVLAHAIHWPFGDDTAHMPDPIGTLRRSLDAEAAERLRREGAALNRADLRVEEIVTSGKPHEHILRVAGDQAADLIVMGVHSHSSFDVALLGSTTHHVIREAHCPVLTVAADRRPS